MGRVPLDVVVWRSTLIPRSGPVVHARGGVVHAGRRLSTVGRGCPQVSGRLSTGSSTGSERVCGLLSFLQRRFGGLDALAAEVDHDGSRVAVPRWKVRPAMDHQPEPGIDSGESESVRLEAVVARVSTPSSHDPGRETDGLDGAELTADARAVGWVGAATARIGSRRPAPQRSTSTRRSVAVSRSLRRLPLAALIFNGDIRAAVAGGLAVVIFVVPGAPRRPRHLLVRPGRRRLPVRYGLAARRPGRRRRPLELAAARGAAEDVPVARRGAASRGDPGCGRRR